MIAVLAAVSLFLATRSEEKSRSPSGREPERIRPPAEGRATKQADTGRGANPEAGEPKLRSEQVRLVVHAVWEGRPIESVAVRSEQSEAITDAEGRAVLQIPRVAGTWVHGVKLGYHDAKRKVIMRDRETVAVQLPIQPEARLKVLDPYGNEIENYTLSTRWGEAVPETLGVQALIRARTIVHAPGYLQLPLQSAPFEHPGTMGPEARAFLFPIQGLARLDVGVTGVPDGTPVHVHVRVDGRQPVQPHPLRASPSLGRLPSRWRTYYGSLGHAVPGEIVTTGPRSTTFRASETMRVFGEGRVSVTAWVRDHAPAMATANLARGEVKRVDLSCGPDPWQPIDLRISDRFGRVPSEAPNVWVLSPVRFRVPARWGQTTIALPREMNWKLVVSATGLGSRDARPADVEQGTLHVELRAVSLRALVLNDRTSRPFRGIDIDVSIDRKRGVYDPATEKFRFDHVSADANQIRVRRRKKAATWSTHPLRIPAEIDDPDWVEVEARVKLN